jgi:hypothetical protein
MLDGEEARMVHRRGAHDSAIPLLEARAGRSVLEAWHGGDPPEPPSAGQR